MKKIMIVLFFALILGLAAKDAKANVFASSVTIEFSGTFPATISYNLNQAATSVTITIKDYPAGNVVKAITVASGANGTLVGFNDVAWDGSLDAGGTASGVYTIEIEASDDTGTSDFERVSYETNPDSWYWSSSGVAVNNRQTSPDFGMVYVAERTGKIGHANGSKGRGIYLHDSHGRYFGQAQAIAFAGGNADVDWDALAGYEGAPMGATVGPDDRVYAFVLSSNGKTSRDGGIVVGDALFSTGLSTVLPFTGDAISDVLVVGLDADRVLYTVEQTSEKTGSDNDSPDDGDGFDASHIRKYSLGTTDLAGAGETIIPTSTLSHPFRIEMDSDGYLYVVQTAHDSLARADNIYGLSKWNISGASPVEMWHIGLNDAPAHADSAVNAHNAAATNFNGLALDEANGLVWVTRKNNSSALNILAYSMATGTYETGFGDGGFSIRDVNIDAAGNVLIVNSSYERLRMFSPAGVNSFNTYSAWAIDVDNSTVVATPIDFASSVNEPTDNVPQQFSLAQNYPNPFNAGTVIEYSLANNSEVSLVIHDLLGREVASLVSGRQSAGTYTAKWLGQDNNGQNVASGIYFYELTIRSGNGSPAGLTKRLLYLK